MVKCMTPEHMQFCRLSLHSLHYLWPDSIVTDHGSVVKRKPVQDGVSPTTASGGLVNGACGYEALSQQEWPFWDVVSIGPNNPIAYKGNKKGCGYCIQATCEGAVSSSTFCLGPILVQKQDSMPSTRCLKDILWMSTRPAYAPKRSFSHRCEGIGSLRGIHHSQLSLSVRQSSAPMQSCGANSKPVTLLVTDACESCAPNQLNLHALAFQDNFNSDLSVGRVNVSFQQVLYFKQNLVLQAEFSSSTKAG